MAGGETFLITRQRHRHHLEECLQCLETFLGKLIWYGCKAEEVSPKLTDTPSRRPQDIDPSLDLVGAAEELRYAAEALGKVTGHVRVDDILDELFSSFCIGK